MKKKWWHNKIAYQIYPKSFLDTNGDGIGDIEGIINKLDYLKDLGIDILWISPMYQSPMVDNGYDISDYYAIDPMFGTMEDMKRLIDEAKKRDMYLLMDLVVNHCSSQHEWFQKAMADPDGEYGTYFYIKEGKNGQPPTNWRSYFGGSVWEKVPGYENKFYGRSLRAHLYRLPCCPAGAKRLLSTECMNFKRSFGSLFLLQRPATLWALWSLTGWAVSYRIKSRKSEAWNSLKSTVP